jgi:pyruvate formate lyase activating enzyme
MLERKALIFNVQKYNTFDGPGVRTMVFFKGCPLRCKWCANPEGLNSKYQVMYRENVCNNCGICVGACSENIHVISDGEHQVIRAIDCTGCRACEKACPQSALAILGEEKTVSELLEIIEQDRTFYDVSGGGVTLGGGDAIIQPQVAANLLFACKEDGINTAVETSGYGRLESLLKLAESTDLFLYDLKLMDSKRHFFYTGVHNESILENLSQLILRKYQVMVRVPLLKDINDDTENIRQMIEFLQPFVEYRNFKGVQLLPYHKLSLGKYPALGLEYTLKDDHSVSDIRLAEIEEMINGHGIKCTVVRH